MSSDLKSYYRCIKAGFNIFELNENFTRRVIWADEVEKYLMCNEKRNTEEKAQPGEQRVLFEDDARPGIPGETS